MAIGCGSARTPRRTRDRPFAATRRVDLRQMYDRRIRMKSEFPSAQEYSAQTARYPALAVVDIRAEQAAVTESYRNQVLVDVNNDCLRLAVFEGEYRWHHHPDSDELFLVVAGTLQIELEGGRRLELAEWQ